jgi:hypothetical protein
MSSPKRDPESHNPPTADDLAGVPVCREEGIDTIDVRGSSSVQPRGIPPLPLPPGPPTANDLAGVPVTAEGEEDLTVRPWKPRQKA